MLKSREVIDELLTDNISPEFFDPHHQMLVESIFAEYISSDRKRLLTRDTYRHILLESKFPGSMMENMTVFDKCNMLAFAIADELGHLKKSLVEGYISRQCFVLLENFKKDSKKDGYLCAAHNMKDGLGNALGITGTGTTNFSSLSDIMPEFIQDLEYRKNNPGNVIRCGYPEIDDVINVGFRAQHLTLFVGDVGSHKSNIMLNVGLSLFERGHSVLFVPLEMNRLDLTSRIIANKAGVNYNKLARPEMLDESEFKRIKECSIWLEKQNRFCILDAQERTSVQQLESEIVKRSMTFHPTVVIIDYIANLKSDRRYGDRNDLEIGEILKSLRFLGKKHNFHIISAAQMGRQAIKAMKDDASAVLDSTSIRGSHEYSADSDTIFGIIKVKDEPDKIKLFAIKARHGPAGGPAKLLHVQPEFCRITSTQNMNILTGDDDILGLEQDLNEPLSSISDQKIKINFVQPSFDEIGDIGG